MWILYLIATVPIIFGLFLWLKFEEINLCEWLGGSLIGLVTCVIFNIISVHAMTHDEEVWSGRVISGTHYPTWIERYKVPIYKTKTDSKGNTTQVLSHYETRYRTHSEY